MSPKYMIFSSGRMFFRTLTAERPPRPESNTPMALFFPFVLNVKIHHPSIVVIRCVKEYKTTHINIIYYIIHNYICQMILSKKYNKKRTAGVYFLCVFNDFSLFFKKGVVISQLLLYNDAVSVYGQAKIRRFR